MPRSDGKIPSHIFLNRRLRLPFVKTKSTIKNDLGEKFGIQVGDSAFVKPINSRCTDKWDEGIVTRLPDDNVTIDVNDIPQHISRIRRVRKNEVDLDGDDGSWITIGPRGRPLRKKCTPDRLGVIHYN